MKKLITILLLFCTVKLFAQTANAGADVTVYLTQGSTATLNGSGSSGTSYLWTDITANVGYPMLMSLGVEGHPTNTGTITSPSSKTTTVTGLTQGTWYYQIAVTTGATTVYDTMVVRVNYDVPPGTYSRGLEMDNPTVLNFINTRPDTLQLPSNTTYGISTGQGNYYYDRSRSNSMYVDTMRAKLYSVVEDGFHWFASSSYARTEDAYGIGYGLDTNKTYCFEWKGYLPQDVSSYTGDDVTIIMQLHTTNPLISDGPTWEFIYRGTSGNLIFNENMHNYNGQNATPAFPKVNVATTLMPITGLVNTTHTIRVTTRQGAGYPGQDAFIKVEIDGVQKYYRNTGQVGEDPLGEDYPKFATMYDYANIFVNPTNHTRNRKVALVTEDFNSWIVPDVTPSPIQNFIIKKGYIEWR